MGAQAAETYYHFPAGEPTPWRHSGLFVALVAGAHVAALALILGATVAGEPLAELPLLSVRLLAAEAPAAVEPAKPQPAPPAVPQRRARQQPAPVLAAASPADVAPSFTVAPQPTPSAAEPAPAPQPQAPQPIVAARFDADYLQNPKPVYPIVSRRNSEEGKVVLRVRVSCQGLPLSVEVSRSSSHARLDDAARVAVEKWRFVPARQGTEAVESWVLVPLVFKLDT